MCIRDRPCSCCHYHFGCDLRHWAHCQPFCRTSKYRDRYSGILCNRMGIYIHLCFLQIRLLMDMYSGSRNCQCTLKICPSRPQYCLGIYLYGCYGNRRNSILYLLKEKARRAAWQAIDATVSCRIFFVIFRLCPPHAGIHAVLLHQFLMRAALHKPSFMQHQNIVAKAAGRKSVWDINSCSWWINTPRPFSLSPLPHSGRTNKIDPW